MSKDDETKLPPLPDEARVAIQAFRAERPSQQARFRIHAALQAAESSKALPQRSPPPPKHAPWRSSAGLRVLAGAVLTGALMLGVTVQLDGGNDTQFVSGESLPSRHVSIQLPKDGFGWVELPWSIDAHPKGMAMVHMETPAEMNFHEHHAEHLPSLQLVSCEGNRCLHQFEAQTGPSAQPLRVRIHKPGRYEFRVSHASDDRHINEHFVVEAEH